MEEKELKPLPGVDESVMMLPEDIRAAIEEAEGYWTKRALSEDTKVFMANGKLYHVEDKLTVRRYRQFQRLSLEAGFGISLEELIDILGRIFMLTNQNSDNRGEIAVIAHNTWQKLTKLKENEDAMLLVAALFINETKENREHFELSQIQAKIRDWEEEGYQASFFCVVAIRNLPGFKEGFLDVLAKAVVR